MGWTSQFATLSGDYVARQFLEEHLNAVLEAFPPGEWFEVIRAMQSSLLVRVRDMDWAKIEGHVVGQ